MVSFGIAAVEEARAIAAGTLWLRFTDGATGTRLPMLFEWRDQHRDELMANWDRLRRGEPPRPVSPLS
jgi:hypothetical protein